MARGSDAADMLPRSDGARVWGKAAMEIDPVCGMEVDPKTAEASWEYEGVTYYFCSRGCLADFEEDPGSYLS